MNRISVIIDTDPGVDDAFAIFLAHASENIDIKALTTTAGNVGIGITTRNTLAIRELLGAEYPVYQGASEPLAIPLMDASDIHGSDGLGHYKIHDVNGACEPGYAWDAIYNTAREHGHMTIIALGPLTNLAISLLRYPDLPKYINKVVSMGGSVGFGNTAPYSEFNYWCDPLAARIVFESELKLEMVGLNATRQTSLNEEELSLLKLKSKKLDDFVQIQKKYYLERLMSKGLTTGFHLPDAVAVAAVVNHKILQCQEVPVKVITDTGMTQGWTVADLRRKRNNDSPMISVAMRADKELFLKELLSINKL